MTSPLERPVPSEVEGPRPPLPGEPRPGSRPDESDGAVQPVSDEVAKPPAGGGFFHRIASHFRKVLQLDDSPEKIARGVALGLFVAFTPTVGIQMPLVILVNTLFRANRLAGVAMVWITNPVTVVPAYWLDYVVGIWVVRLFVEYERIGWSEFAALFDLKTTGFLEQFLEFFRNVATVGLGVGIPLTVGGCVVGAVLGAIGYPITIRLVRRERELRQRLREVRARRRAEKERRKSGRLGAVGGGEVGGTPGGSQ